MAVEAKRGCGYRRIGGLYLEGDAGPGFPCGRLPLGLLPCPLCEHRPTQGRGLQKIVPKVVLHSADACPRAEEVLASPRWLSGAPVCDACPLGKILAQEVAGLMWVGVEHYPTPADFTAEALRLGVSKRLGAKPGEWFRLGESWLLLAHPRASVAPCAACAGRGQLTAEPVRAQLGTPVLPGAEGMAAYATCDRCEGEGTLYTPGVFHAVVPRRVAKIIGDDTPAAERERLEKQGLALVEVPAGDPDHQARKRRREPADDE